MKTPIISLLLFFIIANVCAQSFESIKVYEGECSDVKNKDAVGNSYRLQQSGNQALLNKYNNAGLLEWSVPSGLNDYYANLEVDPSGNIIISGPANNDDNLIVSKFNSTGMQMWSVSTYNITLPVLNSYITPTDMAVDQHGNTFVGGRFYGTYIAGSDTMEKSDYADQESFLLKVGSSGVFEWAHAIRPDEYEYLYHETNEIELAPNGDVIAMGQGDYLGYVWVTRYNQAGDKLWYTEGTAGTFPLTSYNFIQTFSLSTDFAGNIFIAGSLAGTMGFGQYSISTKNEVVYYYEEYYEEDSMYVVIDTELNPIHEAWVVKLNAAGEAQWLKNTESRIQSQTADYAIAKADASGNVYFAGTYHDYTKLGSIELLSIGKTDIFLVKYDSSGNQEWVVTGGGPDYELVTSICPDNLGNVYMHISEGYRDTYIFGDLTWDPENGRDIYVKVAGPVSEPAYQYRVNAGGPELTDPQLNWETDRQTMASPYLSAVSSNHTTGTFYSWNGSNTTGAPKNIFGTNRYDVIQGGPLSYTFPSDPGLYMVNLYFAEKTNGVTAPGARVFDVNINNSQALTDYDIYKEVSLAADKKSFLVTSIDGDIMLDFIRQTGNPQVNGIEIISLNHGAVSPRKSFSLTETATSSRYQVVNPVKNTVVLSSKEEETTTLQVFIYDYTGRVVYQGQLPMTNGYASGIPVPELNPGMYIMKVNEETLKFIKE